MKAELIADRRQLEPLRIKTHLHPLLTHQDTVKRQQVRRVPSRRALDRNVREAELLQVLQRRRRAMGEVQNLGTSRVVSLCPSCLFNELWLIVLLWVFFVGFQGSAVRHRCFFNYFMLYLLIPLVLSLQMRLNALKIKVKEVEATIRPLLICTQRVFVPLKYL